MQRKSRAAAGLYDAPPRPNPEKMIAIEHRYTLLRRLGLACALAVLLVTSLSAYMRLTKAGLGCTDWPACYGQRAGQAAAEGTVAAANLAPGIAAARLVHRVVAVAVLLLALVMLMMCFDSRAPMRREGALALAVLLLALALAVLGRWSSGTRVPAVSIGNLLGGLLMFAACAKLALAGRERRGAGLRGWALAAAVLLLAQVALGGLVSSSFAGLSCRTSTDCSLVGEWRQHGWQGLNPSREARPAAEPGAAAQGRLAHSLHRHLAVVLAAALVGLGAAAWRRGRRRGALLLWLLLALQLLCGALLVRLGLPLPLALMHNLFATLLLAGVIALA